MKNTTIIATLVLAFVFGAAFGQAKHLDRDRDRDRDSRVSKPTSKNKKQAAFKNHIAHIDAMLQQQQNAVNKRNHQYAAAKTTVEYAERLVASSTYNIIDSNNGFLGINDSCAYTYSSDRTSYFNYNHMNYDPIFYIEGDFIMGFGGEIGFPDRNNAPTIFYDSVVQWYAGSLFFGDSFQIRSISAADFDSSNNVTNYTYYDTVTPSNSFMYLNFYDGLGNIVTSLNFIWTSVSWDTFQIRTFFYDTNHRVAEDSTATNWGFGPMLPYERWHYTYDDSGNMTYAVLTLDTGGVWYDWERYNMAYYPNNKLQWDSVSQNNTGTWSVRTVDSFGYQTGIDYVTNQQDWFYGDGGLLTDHFIYTKHIDTLGEPDSMSFYDYEYPNNHIVNKTKYAYLYDTYQEPTTAYQYNFHFTDTSGDGYFDSTNTYIYHYYYALYEKIHHSSVPTTTAPQQQVNIYPNPATNTLSISMPGYSHGAKVLLTLLNAQGQKVRTESLPWLQATTSISLSGLPAGVYWLVVQDGGGNNVGRQMVVKE